MKEIKLIKVGEHYDLYHRIAEENLIIGFASTDNTFVNKLSLKNCQEIENGYDLYELVKSECKNSSYNDLNHLVERGFKAGFQKALEILGDKKFSEEDVKKAILFGEDNTDTESFDNLSNEEVNKFIQSLQQTEFDVEIVMEETTELVNGYKNQPKDVIGFVASYEKKLKPKLDADGCLILKRKI